jgi:peptidyl-prolyl cis-trans isomerase-like 4
VIRDQKTGDSLQYAFIEFENEDDCVNAYFKMDNVLIDDRRIHIDFSQSLAKVKGIRKRLGLKDKPSDDRRKKVDGFVTTKKRTSDDSYEMVFDEGSAAPTEGKLSKKQSKRFMEEDKEQERRREKTRSSDGKSSRSEREREGGHRRRDDGRGGIEREREGRRRRGSRERERDQDGDRRRREEKRRRSRSRSRSPRNMQRQGSS